MSTSAPLLSRYRQLSPTASIRVSPLCLGAMTFGVSDGEMFGECSKETAFAILDHFYHQGGNFIDTANGYRAGESEMWLGEWLASRKNRDDIVLATKYAAGYRGHEKHRIQVNYGGTGTKSMRLSVDASLQKLQTSYIDLLYVHLWDYTVSIPELMHALNDLVASGKVHYLGISDTPAWVVSKANQYARDHGLRQFVVYQGLWNAANRDFERDILPMCRDEGMGLCPYGVLNQGRFRTEEEFRERDQTNNAGGRNMVPLSEHDRNVSRVLEIVAASKGVPLLQVALAYVVRKAPYVFPIVGVRKVEHLMGVEPAVHISLTDAEVNAIENAYEFDPGFPHTFLSGSMFARGTPKGGYAPDDVCWTKMLGTFDWVEGAKPIRPQP
ncbi:sterigmatocystin biosynthesis dehydrogenase stcV [Aspergillus nomiae NRRL 13137]|uniref:Sterigmatocystin biosynthesis dehydrogenase stcV n=2 Tax=Aspergillus nomiae TaxID=41061 RepID=A0A0L1IW31_ASPN3|nr:sterigmatocystin biosynthesis dehydrogenase stcV [Aspergillus nomiae NRRL 13137]AAS90044.1 NorB [Aspergillus nomiae]KNG83771.1 sterigmatocystin biosynthesis dehydrogenase stcV [Aspergillus nomiae NRRL 13137]